MPITMYTQTLIYLYHLPKSTRMLLLEALSLLCIKEFSRVDCWLSSAVCQ